MLTTGSKEAIKNIERIIDRIRQVVGTQDLQKAQEIEKAAKVARAEAEAARAVAKKGSSTHS